MTTVILADDHAVVRDGLRVLPDADSDISVVGDAANGRQANVNRDMWSRITYRREVDHYTLDRPRALT